MTNTIEGMDRPLNIEVAVPTHAAHQVAREALDNLRDEYGMLMVIDDRSNEMGDGIDSYWVHKVIVEYSDGQKLCEEIAVLGLGARFNLYF